MNCFATVCTWNQSLYYSKRSTVCIAQQKHDRTQNDISHIGLTSMVLCHGVQKLEQNRWFRPESFRSPRNACNSSRSFVASFNFARTVSANRYGMLIKIPPSVLHQAFHGTKNCWIAWCWRTSASIWGCCIVLIFFHPGLGCLPNFYNQQCGPTAFKLERSD